MTRSQGPKRSRGERRRAGERDHGRIRREWPRGPTGWAWAGAAVSMALVAAAFDPHLFTGGDNAVYHALAEALATGRGYVDLVQPGAPPHTLYPPGYPALLVPFHWLSGGDIVAMKLLSVAAAAALLAFTYRLGRLDPGVPAWGAAAAVWLVGLYPAFREYAHWVLSDMTFVAIAMGALVVLEGGSRGDGRAPGWGRWMAGCGLALLAFHVRTAGVTLLAATVAGALVARHWRRAGAAATTFAAGVVPWLLWTRQPVAQTASAGYLEQVAAASPTAAGRDLFRWLGERLSEVVVEYGTWQLPGMFWPAEPLPDAARALGAVVGGGLLAWGAWRALRARGVRIRDLYVLLTLGLLVFWPWLGERFLLTVAPLLWFYLLVGVNDASKLLTGGRKAAVALAGAVVVALLVGGVADAARQLPRTRAWLAGDRFAGYDAFWSDYFRAAEWIGENVPADAVVLARKPSLVRYWSGRPAVTYPSGADPEATWSFIRATGVTHFLFEPSTEEALGPALSPRADRLELLYRAPHSAAAVVRLHRTAR